MHHQKNLVRVSNADPIGGCGGLVGVTCSDWRQSENVLPLEEAASSWRWMRIRISNESVVPSCMPVLAVTKSSLLGSVAFAFGLSVFLLGETAVDGLGQTHIPLFHNVDPLKLSFLPPEPLILHGPSQRVVIYCFISHQMFLISPFFTYSLPDAIDHASLRLRR